MSYHIITVCVAVVAIARLVALRRQFVVAGYGETGAGYRHDDNALSPIVNKEKEQKRLKQALLISEIGMQVMDIVLPIAVQQDSQPGERAKIEQVSSASCA